jgi:hypothetical protein
MEGEWKKEGGNIEKTKDSYMILNKGCEGKEIIYTYVWENNIKTENNSWQYKKIWSESVEWIHPPDGNLVRCYVGMKKRCSTRGEKLTQCMMGKRSSSANC